MRFWPQSTGDAVRDAFAFLQEAHNYRLIVDSDAGMGGSLGYRSPELWITVHWDRDDPWLEFSPTDIDDRFDWDVVEHLLRGAEHYQGKGVPVRTAPVPELAAFLRQHLAEIERQFRGPERVVTLARLGQLQAEQQRRVQAWRDRMKPDALGKHSSSAREISLPTTAVQRIDGSGLPFILAGKLDEPRAMVVLLHGSGGNAQNLLVLADRLARTLPGALFVLPEAAYSVKETLGFVQRGMVRVLSPETNLDQARTWTRPGLEVKGDQAAHKQAFVNAVLDPVRALSSLIDVLLVRHGLSSDALAIFGFSQGGMIALHLALHRAEVCAGVICHSGHFFGGTDVRSRPRTLVMIGALELEPDHPQSKVFPLTVRTLRELSVPVEEHVCANLLHDINQEVLDQCRRFLVDVLKQASDPGALPPS